MNTVNPNNFNHTMYGYVQYAKDFARKRLLEQEYTQEQINMFISYINLGLNWAIDDMTMEDAREYANR